MRAALFAVAVAGAATCHARSILQTGPAVTNVVATLENTLASPNNPYVTIKLVFATQPNARGFGFVRFTEDAEDGADALTVFFTASGVWRVVRPGEVLKQDDLNGTLDAQSQYTEHPVNLRVYCSTSHVRIEDIMSDAKELWPDTTLATKEFTHAKVVLCGSGMALVSLDTKSAQTGSIFMVR